MSQTSVVTRGSTESASPASRSVARDPLTVEGRASVRASTTQALHMRTQVPVVPGGVRQSWPDQRQDRQDERSSLYAQPATRSLAVTAPAAPAQAMAPEPGTTQRQAQAVQVQPPAIDVGRLSEDVYQHIQRRIRIERERRGL